MTGCASTGAAASAWDGGTIRAWSCGLVCSGAVATGVDAKLPKPPCRAGSLNGAVNSGDNGANGRPPKSGDKVVTVIWPTATSVVVGGSAPIAGARSAAG